MKQWKHLNVSRSRTWWRCMIFFFLFHFIKWYIRLNVPERKGVGWGCKGLGLQFAWGNSGSAIGEPADGRKRKSNNIEFPDRWATSRFNYFFFFSHLIFSPLLPRCHIFFSCLFTKKYKSICWLSLVLYPSDNERWCIVIRQSPTPAQEMWFVKQGTRQDGQNRARRVEAHRPTCLGSGLCM